MHKAHSSIILSLVLILSITIIFCHSQRNAVEAFFCHPERNAVQAKDIPGDYLFHQRAYPTGTIDTRVYQQARAYREGKVNRQTHRDPDVIDTPWEFAGPTNIGGRVTDIERTPGNPATLYVAAASGGIFKTTDDGATWLPIFDDEVNLSIGDMAISASNQLIIYVGTGEPNAGGGSIAYDGNGVYKSINGGDTWTQLGLEQTGSVGKIVIQPDNPDVCYAGTMGYLFQNNADRGLYKTVDGGVTWEQILFINDSTGIIDIVMHPTHPDTLYAAAWERVKKVDRLSYGGASSGIYRSYNGGDTWQKLTTSLPATAGRIGLAISESDPNIVMAFLTDENNGTLKALVSSVNGGNTWTPMNSDDILQSSFMWWFGKIFIDPTDPDIVYVTSLDMYRSLDGGESWSVIFEGAHVDQHSVYIDPTNPANLYIGNDGGVYHSTNRGDTFGKMNGLPITQFYTCEIDYTIPHRLYGGTQDNNPMRTLTGNVDDWRTIYFGDGFRTLVDPVNNQYVYTESQYGNMARSINGGNSFVSALNGIPQADRNNWNTPFILHPNNPSILYYGSQRLFKSFDRAVSWQAISPDLTGNPPQEDVVYGTITAISVSPLDDQTIYAGTDNGYVQMTTNGGTSWTNISSALPNRWVTQVVIDPDDLNTAYVTFSGYRYGSNTGHIYKTVNGGASWSDISGDFADIPINDLVVIPSNRILCIATDIGVFYSRNDGTTWELLGTDMPNLVITDITYHEPDQFLIAATYGRGIYKLDMSEAVSTGDVTKLNTKAVASPNPFVNRTTIDLEVQSSQEYVLSLYDIEGTLIKQVHTGYLHQGKNAIELDANEMTGGVYTCVIVGKDGMNTVVRLVKSE